MTRHGYSDDCDIVSISLYRSRVARAAGGKRGQKFFVDLVNALDALPEPRLIAKELVTADGSVCAMGAVGLRRGVDLSETDPENPEAVGNLLDIAECLAREVSFENDEREERFWVDCINCWGTGIGRAGPNNCRYCGGSGRRMRYRSETPEERCLQREKEMG